MQIAHYVGMLHRALEATAAAFREVGSAHGDEELVRVVTSCEGDTSRRISWLRSRMKQAAPQVLVVVR